MAIIDEIRVNGQQSSADITPVIAGISPILTWDFESDPSDPAQDSFQILVSTSQINWGNDLFVGSVLDTSDSSSGNSYQYKDHNLSRGTTYYGQIKATDIDGDETVWSKFSFTINRLPFVTNYHLSPSNPTSSDNIDLIYTYNDPDGHDQAGTRIRWFKNNLPVEKYNGLCTLPFSAINPSDSWTAKIIPSDGLEFGAVVETSAVIIQESSAGVSNIRILPLDANIDDILKVEYSLDENEYAVFYGTVVIEWYKNGILLSGDQQYIRTDLIAGDEIYVIVKLTDGESIISQGRSSTLVISDVYWHVENFQINGKFEIINTVDLNPLLTWSVYKTSSSRHELPSYLRVLVTKTPSLDGAIYDTGYQQYVKDSHIIPNGVLSRGQKYFFHVGVGDTTPISDSFYTTKEVTILGSSWSENVNNSTGWTIEFKAGIVLSNEQNTNQSTPNFGIYIHDGARFCVITFGLRQVTFLSDTSIIYTYPTNMDDLSTSISGGKTFRISGKGDDIKIFMNSKLIISAVGLLTNESLLKRIEYGDIDGKNINSVQFKFLRYSTNGAYGFGDNLPDENTFYFDEVGKIDGGSIDSIFDEFIAWTPHGGTSSSKIIKFNENSTSVILPTVSRNYSPITSVYIDERRNKFIGTANGVTAIYGEKHDPDYKLITSGGISPSDFDRISNVPVDKLNRVEPNTRSGWFTIDTTYRSIGSVNTSGGFLSGDPYDPYKYPISSHAIHYYTQRVAGHSWYDNADNTKGWQVKFSFDLENLEADDFENSNLDKFGFGVYINDGNRQEVVYFYEDRIRLYYANVYVPIVTTSSRDYVITGKGDNLLIYQRLKSSALSKYTLAIDGSGLFVTPAVSTGSSYKPKVVIDSTGMYHAVWHDDGNRRSQIIYSSHDGQSWSVPTKIIESVNFNLRNPAISVDSKDRVWVVYEDTSWGNVEISVSVKDSAGWNPKVRITNFASKKGKPGIVVDSNDNVHVVWEDDRDGHNAIFWAQWDDIRQTWLSSGQFGEDTPIMQLSSFDAYQVDDVVEFKNPSMTTFGNYVFVAAEGHFIEGNWTAIYLGFRDLDEEYWNSSGSVILNDSGNFSAWGQPFRVSEEDSNCFNPSICSRESSREFMVIWEDHTSPVIQIWGATYRHNLQHLAWPQQLTNHSVDCINPSCCFTSSGGVIVYEKNNIIYSMSYNVDSYNFISSNNGSTDILVNTGNKIVSRPSLPQVSLSSVFPLVYDFSTDRTDGSLSSKEFPDFQLIGDAIVQYTSSGNGMTPPSYTYNTRTISSSMISNLDTKEFAFGDFSDNIGLTAHWKDFEMYFGYDAKPYSIVFYNQNTVPGWSDNRVNDLFVDSYGNIIAATYGGLIYHNVITNKPLLIEGHSDGYDSSSGCTNTTCLLTTTSSNETVGKITTSVKWSGSGIWYVGTTSGVFYTQDAGQKWKELHTEELGGKIINNIVIDKNSNAVISAYTPGELDGYIFRASIETISTIPMSGIVKALAIDENDIIWAGTSSGLWRVDTNNNKMHFNRDSGMRSSHVNDISIVNKYLRYIATATGIERMNGMSFTNINTKTHEILNDNVNVVKWDSETQSLWVGALYTLHEIVFRDSAHEIIDSEIVYYDNTEISTEDNYDDNIFYTLDYNLVDSKKLSPESTKVYVNKNDIDFGYIVSDSSIFFLTNMLSRDRVEVEISNKFEEFHDFTQKEIEKSVVGEKISNINKMGKTSNQQFLFLSGGDKNGILLYSGESSLPFSTITIDTRPPEGCIEKLETLTRTKIRFRIISTDDLSGVDSYILSNYPNFTVDGTTPQDFMPIQSIVTHDLGEGINNVFDSLDIPDTVVIGASTFSVGTGQGLATWIDETTDARTEYLFAATSSPIIIFKYNPDVDEWTAIQAIDPGDQTRVVTDMKTINNIMYLTTGSPSSDGAVYKSIDGLSFDRIGNTSGANYARGIAGDSGGSVYFGSSNGRIYSTRDTSGISISGFYSRYDNIGDSVYSLSIFGTTMVVGTGNSGRVYTINIQTGDIMIIMDTPDEVIDKVHIKDSDITTSPEQAELFVATSDGSTIYRSNLGDLDFTKSYSSFGVNINAIDSLETIVLEEDQTKVITGTTTIAIIKDTLFKKGNPAWEFLYQHDEEIHGMTQYRTNNIEGVWVISDSKITKWTSQLTEKTVYLRLKDKAGNVSLTPDASVICPDTSASKTCCTAYKLQISDLKDYVHEGRIVDIDSTGTITYTYDSPNNKSFFSADQIDQEVGIYISEIINGSNDLVAWQSITWESEEPSGTVVNIQIRSGVTEDAVTGSEWSTNLIKNIDGYVSIEHVTDQYIQFKAILVSQVRDLSPSLSSITLRNLTSQASHFFTTNFVMPSRPIKGILTANTYLPVSSDVVFGINTKNSVDFGDYQIIEPNRLFTTTQGQFGENLRIGAKLLSPGLPQLQPSNNPGDPYDAASYICSVTFDYTNLSSTQRYHFRVRFYNDPFRTQLVHTFFSGNDQTGWSYAGSGSNLFPWNGVEIIQSDTQTITFEPLLEVSQNQKWYITVEAHNGSNYEDVVTNYSYICSACNISYEPGLVTEYYNPGATITSMPIFSSLNPDYIYNEPNIDFPETTSTWETKDPLVSNPEILGFDDNFAVRFRGSLTIPVSGTYSFKLESNAGSKLYIDSELVIDNDGLASYSTPAVGTASLGQGNHSIEVQYFDNTGSHGITLSWTPPSGAEEVIPTSSLSHPVASEYCDINTPQIFNFAILFELENGETQKINLLPPS